MYRGLGLGGALLAIGRLLIRAFARDSWGYGVALLLGGGTFDAEGKPARTGVLKDSTIVFLD